MISECTYQFSLPKKIMVSLNYTFPGALLSFGASLVSQPQLSPLRPKALPRLAPGRGMACGWAGPPTGYRAGVPGKRNLGVWAGPAVRQHSHSQFAVPSYWVSGPGLPWPPKFPVYDVILVKFFNPVPWPPTPDSCHHHPMARTLLDSSHDHALLGLRGKAGLGKSELHPSSSLA